jgi:hypothetical protein
MPLTGAFERDALKSPGTAERAPGAGHADF